jgi:hypothetical protein
VLDDVDGRKMAFLFGIDEFSGWDSSSEDLTAPTGPLWVHFDPRVPATVMTTEHLLRLEDPPGAMGFAEEDIRVWGEQIDVVGKRVVDQEEARFKLPTMLSLSCASEAYRGDDARLGMDYGLNGSDSGIVGDAEWAINPHILRNNPVACEFRAYKQFVVVIDRADFTTSSVVRFLTADGGQTLEDGARSSVELQAWRSAGLDEVVRRLAFLVPAAWELFVSMTESLNGILLEGWAATGLM